MLPLISDIQPTHTCSHSVIMPTMEELMEKMVQAITAKDEQIKKLLENMDKPKPVAEAAPVAVPKISINEFQHTEELWSDYIKRFATAATACQLPENLKAATFLSKQSRDVYKELDVYATQLADHKMADGLTYSEITTYMNTQYSPKRYEIRERYNYGQTANGSLVSHHVSLQPESVRWPTDATSRTSRTL